MAKNKRRNAESSRWVESWVGRISCEVTRLAEATSRIEAFRARNLILNELAQVKPLLLAGTADDARRAGCNGFGGLEGMKWET